MVHELPYGSTIVGSGVGTLTEQQDKLTYTPCWNIDEWLSALWMSPSKRIYACSASGVLFIMTPGSKKPQSVTIEAGRNLQTMWGLDDEHLFLGGSDGFLAELRDGKVYPHRHEDEYQGNIFAIFGTAHDNVYAVGDYGAVFHFDGAQWHRIPTSTKKTIHGGVVAPSGQLWVCGEKGLVLARQASGKWKQISGFPSQDLFDMAQCDDAIFVAAGDQGLWKYAHDEVKVCFDEPPCNRVVQCGKKLVTLGQEFVVVDDGENCFEADLS